MTERGPDPAQLAEDLCARYPATARLDLRVGSCTLGVATNSGTLQAQLADYFRHFRKAAEGVPDFHVTALQAPEPDFGVTYHDWPRDPGKSGRKDTFLDVLGGRLVRKVRTGMQFILLPDRAVAVGDCERNRNQIVNLVNSQYLSWRVRRGYLVCHSAAVLRGRGGLALSGFSGAGKSTLALRLISRGLTFVSNDRLLVGRQDGQLHMAGVPKMPRINPGTILGNPELWPMVSDERRAQLAAMPRQTLWDLEEKYDVDIERLFGPGRVAAEGPLTGFAILAWSSRNEAPALVWRGRLRDRPDLLPAVVKHPGVFHTDPRRGPLPPPAGPPDPKPYLDILGDLPVLSFSGGVDFDRAADLCEDLLAEGRGA